MKWIIVLSVMCVSSLAFANDAQRIEELQKALNEKQFELAKHKGVMAFFTEENEKLLKENKLLDKNREEHTNFVNGYMDNIDKELAAIRKNGELRIADLQAEWDKLGCVGTLSPEKYNWCLAKKAEYDSKAQAIDDVTNRTGMAKAAEANAAVRPYQEIIKRQTARIDEIASQVTKNLDKHFEALQKLRAVEKQISKIRLDLTDLCSNAKHGSASYQLCNDINWDGKRSHLPSMRGSQKPPSVITPNN